MTKKTLDSVLLGPLKAGCPDELVEAARACRAQAFAAFVTGTSVLALKLSATVFPSGYLYHQLSGGFHGVYTALLPGAVSYSTYNGSGAQRPAVYVASNEVTAMGLSSSDVMGYYFCTCELDRFFRQHEDVTISDWVQFSGSTCGYADAVMKSTMVYALKAPIKKVQAPSRLFAAYQAVMTKKGLKMDLLPLTFSSRFTVRELVALKYVLGADGESAYAMLSQPDTLRTVLGTLSRMAVDMVGTRASLALAQENQETLRGLNNDLSQENRELRKDKLSLSSSLDTVRTERSRLLAEVNELRAEFDALTERTKRSLYVTLPTGDGKVGSLDTDAVRRRKYGLGEDDV